MNFANIPHPYLPSLPEETKLTIYTLVLDLDETLVHYVNVNKYFLIFITLFRWVTQES